MTRYSLKILKGIRITKLFRIDAPVTRFYQWLKSFADPLEDHMSLRISDGTPTTIPLSESCGALDWLLQLYVGARERFSRRPWGCFCVLDNFLLAIKVALGVSTDEIVFEPWRPTLQHCVRY
jgi:hypothetical protein